jgi:hypothetical protein
MAAAPCRGEKQGNSMRRTGFVRVSAAFAQAFVREQLLALVAPMSFLRPVGARRDAAGGVSTAVPCGPNRVVDLQPTGAGRS